MTTKALDHFLELAAAGRWSYATEAECSAACLGNAARVGVPCLDDLALDGLIEYIGICKAAPTTAAALFDGGRNDEC